MHAVTCNFFNQPSQTGAPEPQHPRAATSAGGADAVVRWDSCLFYQAAIPGGMMGKKGFSFFCKPSGKPSKRSNPISPAGGGLRGWKRLNHPPATDSMYYVHTDHVGSICAITDTGKQVVQRNYFGPFGDYGGAYYEPFAVVRQDEDTLKAPGIPPNLSFPLTTRGFTGHEHYPQFKIINMNGRLYDPVICRFFSPDNFVQAPEFSQDYNRYSYCRNSPLKYTDPDGMTPFLVVPLIKGIIGAAVDIAAQVTISRANGQSFGQAMSNIDYTSVGGSFVLSALGAPKMSTIAKAAIASAVAIDAALDMNFNGEMKSIAGIIGDQKPASNIVIDAAAAILPGKAIDGITSTFNKAVTSDLTVAAAATLTKETKSGLRQAQALANSTTAQTSAKAIADFIGKTIGDQMKASITTTDNTTIIPKIGPDLNISPVIQPSDATRLQQLIYSIYP